MKHRVAKRVSKGRRVEYLSALTRHLTGMHHCDAYRVEQSLARHLDAMLPKNVIIEGIDKLPLKCRCRESIELSSKQAPNNLSSAHPEFAQ